MTNPLEGLFPVEKTSLKDASISDLRELLKEAANGSVRRPDIVCLADIVPKDIRWLWRPYLASGMLTMLSGDPGVGKSYLGLAIAAAFSRGNTLEGEPCEPLTCLYLTVENPHAEVVRPRFDLLGGDATRMHLLRGWKLQSGESEQHGSVSLNDVQLLSEAIEGTQARFIVVDPLQSYLGPDVDTHRSNETRPILDGLAKLAEQFDCSILLLRHLSKQTGAKSAYRGLGSIDFTAAVRSEIIAGVLPDEPQRRAVIHIKSNLGPLGPSLEYAIHENGSFKMLGPTSLTADNLLAASARSKSTVLDSAMEWLRDFLAGGPKTQHECESAARTAGFSYGTLRRAKTELEVQSTKDGMNGSWLWSLEAEGAQAR